VTETANEKKKLEHKLSKMDGEVRNAADEVAKLEKVRPAWPLGPQSPML
jgi:hypothetical protein